MEASGLDGLGGVSGRMNGVLEGESDYEVFDSGGGVCDETVSSDGEFPKPLLKVGEKVILDWLVDDLAADPEIDEFIVVTNHKFVEHFVR